MLKEIHPILEASGVIFAYLFGSQANGRAHKNSDVDIALYLKEKNPQKRFETKLFLSSKLSSALKKEVDIVILNDIKDNFLLFDILHEGKVIYNIDDDLRFHFEVTERHKVIDYLTHLEYLEREMAQTT